MALLTGKANISGGNIYSTTFCPLYIGKKSQSENDDIYRSCEIYSKHLDLKGCLNVTDSENLSRITLDNTNNLHFFESTNFDTINTDTLQISNNLIISNASTNITLENDKQFIACRTNDTENNYMVDLNSTNALQITGKCNIIGELYINSNSLSSTISNEVDNALNNLHIISLQPIDNIAGLVVENSGLIWKNNKFNLLKNISITNNEVVSNNGIDEFEDLCVGNITLNKLYNNQHYHKIGLFDLDNTSTNVTDINTESHMISQFTNGNGSTKIFNLTNPIINGYAINHQLIADNNLTGIVEITGSIICPDGNSNNKKIVLKNPGESVQLTYIGNYWYICNSGGSVV